MATLTAGTCTVTNNSRIVTFTGAELASKGVDVGNYFFLKDESNPYRVAIKPTDDITLTLLEEYAGPTQTGMSYQIYQDIGLLNLIRIYPDMKQSGYAIDDNFKKLALEILNLQTATIKYRTLPRFYIGIPIKDQIWGFNKWVGSIMLVKIRLSTMTDLSDTPISIDLLIDGVRQNINLTLPAYTQSIESDILNAIIQASSITSRQWLTPNGVNAVVDMVYYNTSIIDVQYDFNRYVAGDMIVDKIIGDGYKPSSHFKLYGLYYEWTESPEGSPCIIEARKNQSPTGSLFTLPAQSQSDWLQPISQIEYLSTDYLDFSINQVGSSLPGNGLSLTALTYPIYT